jgi:hypothetical protein
MTQRWSSSWSYLPWLMCKEGSRQGSLGKCKRSKRIEYSAKWESVCEEGVCWGGEVVIFYKSRKRFPYLMNWCLENMLPDDVDVNLFKCYGILSIMEPDWKLITEIYNHGLWYPLDIWNHCEYHILARNRSSSYCQIGADLEHIINFAEVKRISMYRYLTSRRDNGRKVCGIHIFIE